MDTPANQPRRSYLAKIAGGVAVLLLIGILAATGVVLWALSEIPFDQSTQSSPPDRTVILEAADGSPLGRIGALTSTGKSLDEYPDHLIDAVIAIEDQRFRQHFGIDPVGIARAFRRNISAGRIVEGGSTITQQLVKVQYLSSERSYTRKLREAATAVWLETRLSKDEILTRYLNRVYLGAGAYGMPAAARLYFDKEPIDLTLGEAALLAGLIRAPSRYNPLRNLSAAQERARLVLDAMTQTGAASADEIAEAKQNPPSLDRPAVASPAGTWFADWVGREALNLIGSLEDGVRVRTTLVPEYQRVAEEVVRRALADNEERGVTQAALVAMRPDGAVVAMVGGREYDNSQFNRAVQAKRQPGSAFKLFVYMAALRKGYGLNDTVDSAAPEIDGWRPSNFGDRDYGRMTMADAFAKSVNTASVNLAMDAGLENVVAAARDLGIEAPLEPVPSIALGSEELSLLSLTAAYAGVLSPRAPVEPWGVSAFSPRDQGRYMSVSPPGAPGDTLGPAREPLMELLQLPVERGTARAAALDDFAAGKTGTSQEYRDAWFIGFNRSLVVGIWVGNDESEPMDGVTGGSVPAVMWKTFMTGTGAGTDDSPGVPESEPTPSTDEPLVSGLPKTVTPPEQPGALTSPANPAISALPETPAPEPASSAPEAAESPAPRHDRAPIIELPPGAERRQASRQPDQETEAPQCDIRACSSTYQSFNPSDCTYQPYGGGPRVRCGKGQELGVQASAEEPAPRNAPAGAAREMRPAMCNVSACAQNYSSFRASDCTYQPYGGGPRQICDK